MMVNNDERDDTPTQRAGENDVEKANASPTRQSFSSGLESPARPVGPRPPRLLVFLGRHDPHDTKGRAQLAIREMLTYAVFLIVFTLHTTRYRDRAEVFYLGDHLKGQLMKQTSENFPKTFEEIATVDNLYSWMETSL